MARWSLGTAFVLPVHRSGGPAPRRSRLGASCLLGALLALGLGRADAEPPGLLPPGGGAPIPTQKTPPGVVSQSAQACAACHWQIYEEWRGAMHSAAWSDPQFQELWRTTGREQSCLNCHSPMAAQQASAAGQPNLGFEPTLQSEGVTCAVCHLRDGRIVGRGTSVSKKIPHPVEIEPSFGTTLGSAELCASCHQQPIAGQKRGFYDTHREWAASQWAAGGIGCAECHLPAAMGTVAPGVVRTYRSHRFRGGHSDPMLDRALAVRVLLDRPTYEAGQMVKARIVVSNAGAGHAVPSGDPAHQIRLVAGIADRRGEYLDKKEVVFARKLSRSPPYEEASDTCLRPGEARTIRYEGRFAGGLGEHYIVVQLSFHFMPPEHAHELGIPAEVVGRVFHSQVIPITP